MHEILTIQTGPRANFLATHFWNTQLAYQSSSPSDPSSPVNHNIHFRPGLSSTSQETFLPRTLIYDLKTAFGSLARSHAVDAMLDAPSETDLWSTAPTSLATNFSPAEASAYTASLAEGAVVKPTRTTVKYFADFASSYFHQRSLQPLNPPYPSTSAPSAAQSEGGVAPQFSSFEHGAQLFTSLDAEHDVLDAHVRPWIEECDAVQGIQLLNSTQDAWGGFSARYLERLRDEYGKLPVWIWGVDGVGHGRDEGRGKERVRERASNLALSVSEFASLGGLFVPLGVGSMRGVKVERGNLWEEGALLCAGLESMTLPGRMLGGSRAPVMGDWENVLCDGGRRKIGSLRIGVGGRKVADGEGGDKRIRGGYGSARQEQEDGEQAEERLDHQLDITLSPLEVPGTAEKGRPLRRSNKTFARVDAFRNDKGEGISSSRDQRMPMRAGPLIEEYDTQPRFPLLDTFPNIFEQSQSYSSLPIHTSLATSSSIATWVRNVRRTISAGVGLPGELGGEERESLGHSLADIAEAYVEGWESDSEEEDE